MTVIWFVDDASLRLSRLLGSKPRRKRRKRRRIDRELSRFYELIGLSPSGFCAKEPAR